MTSRQVLNIEQKKTEIQRRIVLIIEKNDSIIKQLVDVFEIKGFKAYAEKSVEKAKTRVRLLDQCDIKLDSVIIDYKISDKESFKFIRYISYMHENMKTMILVNPEENTKNIEKESNAAIIDTGMDMNNVVNTIKESFDYSQEAFRIHMKKVREVDKIERRIKEFRNRNKDKQSKGKFTTNELNRYKKLKIKANKVIAEKFMDVLKSSNRNLKKKQWIELKRLVIILHHENDLNFSTIKRMVKTYSNFIKIA